MLNGIECLGKVQLEENDFFLGGLTLMYVFEGPS